MRARNLPTSYLVWYSARTLYKKRLRCASQHMVTGERSFLFSRVMSPPSDTMNWMMEAMEEVAELPSEWLWLYATIISCKTVLPELSAKRML